MLENVNINVNSHDSRYTLFEYTQDDLESESTVVDIFEEEKKSVQEEVNSVAKRGLLTV